MGLPHGKPDGRSVALETRPRLALDGQRNLSLPLPTRSGRLVVFLRTAQRRPPLLRLRSQAVDQQGGQAVIKTSSHLLTRLGAVPLLVILLSPLWTKGNSGYHSLFLKNDGSLNAMGSNAWGEFGIGSTSSSAQTSPVQIQPSGVIQFASGHRHVVIVKSDGSAYAMGQNTSGALGNANYIDQTSPAQIFPSGVKSVAAGAFFTLLLKNDGSLHVTGSNANGQLGTGDTSNRNSPFQIISSGVTGIAGGTNHSLILKSNGSVFATGQNNYGQLGTGNTNNFNAPTQIFSSGVIQIASGAEHSLFLKADGSLWATGRNQRGQLGTGDTVDRNSSTQIVSSGVIQVASGSEHSVFLKSDGSLHVMGSNINGQLGTGDNLDRNSSVQILSSGVVEIAAGASHTVFLKADGSLWTFGWNSNGQLGVGDTANRSVPTMVLPSGVTRLSEVTDDFRHFPTDLNSTAALAFAENQPIGTVVGEFNSSDPDLNRRFTQDLGTKVWEFETGGAIWSKPALASNGMVFFGSKDNKFYALDSETGAELWKFTGSHPFCKPSVGQNGRVYVGTENGKIYSFDFQGNKLWEFATGDKVVASPTLDGNGKLYVGSCDNKFYALNCNDGTKVWEFNAGSQIHTKTVLSKDGKLFFGTAASSNAKLYALDSSDGSKIWEFTVAQKIWSSPALGLDGTVYFGCHDGKIYALDPGDGSMIWTHNAQSAVAGPVTLGYDDTLFAITSSGKLLALDSKTGTQKWAFNTGSSGTRNTPTVASDNSVYFGDKNGKLYSINGNDGTKLWDLQVGNGFNVSSPCIARNGKLLIGSQDNKLYCVQASAPLASDAVWPAYGFDNKKTGSRKPHLTYHLASGPGDVHNSLFTLETNGTLKTATTFDYESNASSYSIRVQVKDEFNATVEGNFTVTLTNDLTEDSDGDGFTEAEEVLAGTNPNDPASKPGLNFGLVAYYPFDGNASDMSGNGNHGTNNGALPGMDRHGVLQKAYSFDGQNDYVTIQNWQVSGLDDDYSLSIWFRWNGPNAYEWQYLLVQGWVSIDGAAPFRLQQKNDKLYFYAEDSGQGSLFTVQTDKWYHLTCVHTGSSKSMYVDGNLIHSESSNGIPSQIGSIPVNIGGISHFPTSYPWNGSLDQVRIYNRALSASEVEALYRLESDLPSGSVTTGKLDPSLGKFLDGNATIEQALPAGSVIAVKPGDPAPAGYTLFQRNEYNATLTWEEKAPVSVGRWVFDGMVTLDGKIYVIGGSSQNGQTGHNILERYTPGTNQWDTLNPMTALRKGIASTVLNGKIWAIGGSSASILSSVEIYDPQTNSWSPGPALPIPIKNASAETIDGKIYLIGGHDGTQPLNKVIVHDPATNGWIEKASMSAGRHLFQTTTVDGKILAVGGAGNRNDVETYDPVANQWTSMPNLNVGRISPSTWSVRGITYVAGGYNGGSWLNSVERFDSALNAWATGGNLPEAKEGAGSIVLGEKVYLASGRTSGGNYSNKVYAADLPAPAMHLYFKDGNATAEAATSPALDGNLTITLNMLAPDALAKLDVNRTHAQSAGSVIAIPRGSQPPPGYSLYKRSDRNETLVWEEKAPVSLARQVYDGVETLDGKIYTIGGRHSSNVTLVERYDPASNQWETITSLSVARSGLATAVMDGKLFAIGGSDDSSVEIYDPTTGQWAAGTALPATNYNSTALTVNDSIWLLGGNANGGGGQVLRLAPNSNQWTSLPNMATPRTSSGMVLFDKKVWAIGGAANGQYLDSVEVFDLASNSWSSGPSLTVPRQHPMAWTAHGKIYVAGGRTSNWTYYDSIEVFDPTTNQWSIVGNMPEKKSMSGHVVVNGIVYLVAGSKGDYNHSDKVFAADITPPMDLYFRDANATGTVSLDKLDGAVVSKLEGNVSALSPIRTVSAIDHNAQPQANQRILERTDRNATHAWEEMAPISVGRNAFDGVEVLDGKIYFIGGRDGAGAKNITERYDPKTNQWET